MTCGGGEECSMTESLWSLYVTVAFKVEDCCGDATAALSSSSVGELPSMAS